MQKLAVEMLANATVQIPQIIRTLEKIDTKNDTLLQLAVMNTVYDLLEK